MNNLALIDTAQKTTVKAHKLSDLKEDWKYMGYVGAALLSGEGKMYTGVNLEFYCSIGFCAEHSAVAEMVKNGETRIKKIVAVTNDNQVIPPCGRCRELMYQIDKRNLDTEVIMDNEGNTMKLQELLPNNWQPVIGF